MTHRITLMLAAFLLTVASQPAHAGTAFLDYEIDDGGMHKQCVYDYLGERYVITIPSIKLCPLTIQVP